MSINHLPPSYKYMYNWDTQHGFEHLSLSVLPAKNLYVYEIHMQINLPHTQAIIFVVVLIKYLPFRWDFHTTNILNYWLLIPKHNVTLKLNQNPYKLFILIKCISPHMYIYANMFANILIKISYRKRNRFTRFACEN